ncbi:AAA family ATPase [Natrinema versiforme]|uniref:ATPase associated with various cellular activities AAA 3 n=1 Tax=Natrinema versiforme JCM 10478 TaxID=1227496 RepID=L9XM36_9EURY|nr:MoxR family ATPase [Natrinema versiforme]ELY62805.1 ATPase associated with various cellular activities AAA 3 [Natrinema versiforme JCM 10478]
MNGTTDPGDGESSDPEAVYDLLQTEINRVLIGNDEAIEYLTIALLTRGHLLLEGVPGIAKTTLANLFARTTGLEYNRIQMTPDTLPADITGTHIYRQGTGTFELQRGPVFANLVVADEINRATPKTQSALLEAMEERRVTIEGETLSLPDPFMVVATQNPIESEGVFQLPEAQRDRFQFKLTLDLPERANERELLDRFDTDPELGPEDVEQTIDPSVLVDARQTVRAVYVAPAVKEYVLDLVAATREHADIDHGASPRATLAFLNGAKARAAINGRDYAIPDDIKSIAEPVLRHRLVLSTDADLSNVDPAAVVAEIVDTTEPPSAETDQAFSSAAASDGGNETLE